MEGAVVESTNVLEIKGPDESVFTMYETATGPSDTTAMKIESRRRK